MFKYSFICSLVILLTQGLLFAQTNNTCNSSDIDELIDLNSISKCTIEEKVTKNNSSNKDVKVQVTARRHIVRKKQAFSVLKEEKKAELANIESDEAINNSLNFENKNYVERLHFSTVENVPLFNNCEKKSLKAQKKCFHVNMFNHVNSNLKYPKSSFNKGIQGKVLTQFVIDTEGNVKNLNTEGPYLGNELIEEAERIISILPKLKPAKHLGKPVEVIYAIPITFNIAGKKATNKNENNTVTGNVYDFNELDALPYFSSCKDKSGQCFDKKLIKHITQNFYYPQDALDSYIEGKVAVYFTIDSNGNVADVKAIGPVNGILLEQAAIDLFNKLPKLTPGVLNGQNVNSKYIFPVEFKIY